MFSEIINLLRDIISGLYNLIVKGLLGGLWNIITGIQLDPLILLIIAIVFAVFLVVIIMIISEKNIIGRLMRKLGYFGLGLAELPYAIYESLDHLWMKFLKSFGRFITSNMVTKNSRTFYRKIVLVVLLYALWTFVWGLLILTNEILKPEFATQLQLDPNLIYKQISYFIIVILLSGFLAGNVLLFVLSRVLKIVSKNKYQAHEDEIADVRHKSLLAYIQPKENLAVLSITDLARLVDIPKDQIASHFNDKVLKDWVLIGNSIVNERLYKERIDYVEELVDEGLDNEDIKPLIKAIDYLSFMQKGFRNVSQYIDDLEERKEMINEDIADIRGLYGSTTYVSNEKNEEG
jgi:hypothetical protein